MGSAEPGALEVERLILRSVAALVIFLLAAAIGVALTRDEEIAGTVSNGDGGVALERGTIGPLPGATLEAYERSARRRLSEAIGRRVAVVSFSRYLTDKDARAIVAGATALLVAAPQGEPRMVEDVGAWAESERAAARSEKAELEALIPTVEDPAFATQYRRDIARLERLLARIDPAGRIVFAAVVEADAADLRLIANDGAVRLVDVARNGTGEVKTFRGMRPEERAVANEPPTRP